jgi:hypothetical protein
MADVKCPLCGCTVDARGLKSHQGSYECVTKSTYRENKAAGLTVFKYLRPNSPFFTTFKDLFKRDIVGYTKGWYRHRSKFQYGYWGPQWLYPLWQLYGLASPQDRKLLITLYKRLNEADKLKELAQVIAGAYDDISVTLRQAANINSECRKLFWGKLCSGDILGAIAIIKLSR